MYWVPFPTTNSIFDILPKESSTCVISETALAALSRYAVEEGVARIGAGVVVSHDNQVKAIRLGSSPIETGSNILGLWLGWEKSRYSY